MTSAGYARGDMPAAERLTEEVLALPMFPEILPEEQEYVVSAVFDFYGK
jgi:dTDP-4-amino-4,6-dideoxygalactose transaminase